MFKRLTCLVITLLMLIVAGGARAELIAQWTFNEKGSETALDITGNGHNGVISGKPVWTPGKGGAALQFDGVDDYVSTGQSLLSNLSEFSLACWIKPVNYTTNRTALIGQNDCIEFGFNGGGGLRCYNVAVAGNVNFAYPYKSDEWHHVAATGDVSGMRLYIDGKLVAGPGTAPPAGGYGKSTFPVNIGSAVWDATGNWYKGEMDDVRIYNHALTAQELADAMNASTQIWPYAYNPNPANGSIVGTTWVNLQWTAGGKAASHNVYLADNLGDVDTGAAGAFRGNQTLISFLAGLPGFAYPDGLVPGTTYYWRIDEVNAADPSSPWKGNIWSFSIAPRTAYNPSPADGAEFVDPNAKLTWTAGFGAKLHTVYLGDTFDTVNNAAGGLPQGATTYTPATLQSEKVYYWRVDEFDGTATHKGNIWAFTTPGAAGNPKPANGASGVQMISKLSWTPATNATSHDVYFGTDKEAVRNATTASPQFKGNKAKGSETYDPGKLAWYTPYYWRVDAVYATGTVKGLVWSFTTADFISVDDFESYNDLDPPNAASNRIFDKWVDGFANPTTNGALVGNDMPPYAERATVHSGAQSMPYRYDNANKTSEATMTLVYPRDWTEQGVTKLSLWFRGSSANSAEKLYVVLNGSAVVYHPDPAATQKGGWNQWIIDLSSFQGVTLTNVNTITIGFGTKGNPSAAGGKGKVYFDDIRLMKP